MNPGKQTDTSLEISSLLLGIAPSEENRGLVERHYLFGDAQQATTSPSSYHVTESLAFHLGLPPTAGMCKVTNALYNTDDEDSQQLEFQTPQRVATRVTNHTSPSTYATPEYDVVKSVVDACSSTAEKYARQLYKATHTSKKNSCTAKQSDVQRESLTMPEELLGA